MDVIQQTVTVPAGNRLWVDLPQSVPAGTTAHVTILLDPSSPRPARVPHPIGFLKGQISVPDDFDTMGQEEIIALFEGEKQS